MEFIYQILKKEVLRLEQQILNCHDLEEKAELIGNKILTEHSIKLLKKCDEHGIAADSIFTKLPQKITDSGSSEYRVVEDSETDNSQYWQEVKIEGKTSNCVRLNEGDVLIQC